MNGSVSHLTQYDHCICSQVLGEKIFRQFGVGFHGEDSTTDNDIYEEGNGEGNDEDVVSCISSPVGIHGRCTYYVHGGDLIISICVADETSGAIFVL